MTGPDAPLRAGDPMAAHKPAGRRWTAARKAHLLLSIMSGSVGLSQAMADHDLSEAELVGWMTAFEVKGEAGLRADAARARQ